ncbi:3-deoxy-7-phosphoheptulonate synthase [Nocardiopsis sp. N85]|uniref:3-deoxy-7-phosphoheptulonate synthase n=1 Tax=Nocardiopsis sp. N85 TaxID=3029400 RepID=UPI00237EEF16|nr:3-deoxy-7-phosphoheptulonate synthase [Nocardiopsis sp. N85]MDE3723784.1 3-deoxy-7-phosphoheptulonate synthase [Nocardiopsis sp. N85]
MKTESPDLRRRTALQQPDWGDDPRLPEVRERLRARPGLVRIEDVDRLSGLLARVASGEARVVTAGDCAEDPERCGPEAVGAQEFLVGALAEVLEATTGRPVVRVGRIGGQFAKPRSRPTEIVEGRELPVYRGHLVNAPEPTPTGRAHDPERLLACHDAARTVLEHLGRRSGPTGPARTPSLWTAHEALVLDYEVPALRRTPDGRTLLTSTHWPWVGDRTRHPEGAHIALLSGVANPVACKVGPSATVEELLEVCDRLDPERRPGRLTLISRQGVGGTEALRRLVAAVRAAGHPAIWMSDPMHGNTVRTPSGLKTRYVSAIVREVREFQAAVRAAGGIAGGLHLEATHEPVTECVSDASRVDRVADRYTSLCDPRLNPAQAVAVASAWTA